MGKTNGDAAPRGVVATGDDFVDIRDVKKGHPAMLVPSVEDVKELSVGARVNLLHISEEVIRVIVMSMEKVDDDPFHTKFQGAICIRPSGDHSLLLQAWVRFEGRHVYWAPEPKPVKATKDDFIDTQKERNKGAVLAASEVESRAEVGAMVRITHCSGEEIWAIIQTAKREGPDSFAYQFEGFVCAAPSVACGIVFQDTVGFEGRHIRQLQIWA